MQKATEFSKKEMIFVIVNSIITKLFLFYPSTLISIGKSASILLCLSTIVVGYIVLMIIAILYEKIGKQNILRITQNVFGKYVRIIYSLILSGVFIVLNGLLLRTVSESINLSLMPNINVNLISLVFIFGISIAVYSGLKAIIRCHAIIVPITLTVVAILFISSIKSFDINRVFPVFGDGINTFGYSFLLSSFFSDYFIVTLIFPYMQKSVPIKKVIRCGFIISSVVLLAIISAVLLAVENNSVIPVFRLAQNFSYGASVPRLESIFTATWFLSFFLNFSMQLYFSCKLFCGNKKENIVIIPFGFLTFGASVLPSNIYCLKSVLDYMSIIKITVFFVIPFIVLSVANIKYRRSDG